MINKNTNKKNNTNKKDTMTIKKTYNTAAKLQKMADDYTLTGNTVAGYTYIVHYKADGINTFAVCLPGRPSINKKGESIIVPIK